MKENKLSFSNVTYTYHTVRGEVTATEDLTFSLDEGEFVCVLGPSGCGKSTLLSLAAGLLSPASGEICRRGTIGYMLQRDELFPWRTIEKNLFLPLEVKRTLSPETKQSARALAAKYGLEEFLQSYPSQLSGECGSGPRSSAPSSPSPISSS